jgi:formylglycine-generating enzyme required for sulfatase activity
LHGLCEVFHFERGLAQLTLKARRFVGRAFAAEGSEWLRRAWTGGVRLKDAGKHLTSVARSPQLGMLTALDLSGNDLDDGALEILLASPHLGRLACLDLRANRLSDRAARALVQGAPPRLAWLDLRANGLTADGMRALLGSPLGGRLRGLELNAPDLDPDTVRDLVAWRGGRDLAERRGGLPLRLVNGLGMEFRLVPAGTFLMGSPESEPGRGDGEDPRHEVELTRPFYLGVYPVTQREFRALMGHNPSHFTPERGGGPLQPVEMVSWEDCRAFCERLSAREPERGYRLPTEAEWEHACRAGTTTAYCFGDDAGKLGEYAWYSENAGRRTHEVGTRQPTAWGLFDMHGNVWEWCEDHYNAEGSARVFRGGGWYFSGSDCRASDRDRLEPAYRGSYLGFRLAAVPSGE